MAYRGIKAVFPIALQGLHGARNPSKLGPGHLTESEGVDVDGGVIVKEGGASKFTTSTLAGVIKAGWGWFPTFNVFHNIVLIEGGTVRRDSAGGPGNFGTLMRSGLADPDIFPPVFVECGGEALGNPTRLLMFSDTNQVQVVNGNATGTMADIPTPAADWATNFPTFGVQHANRVFAGGNANDKHRLYYTTLTNHRDFAGGGTISIFPGEGHELVGAVSYKGLLICWKRPRGIYVVDTRDPSPANWSVTRLTRAVGAAGPRSIVVIQDDVLFLDPTGTFHLLSSVQEFGDTKSSDIGQFAEIRTYLRRVAQLSNFISACGVWYQEKSKAYFHLPKTGSSDTLDLRLIIDFSDVQQSGIRYYPSTRDEGPSLWLRWSADDQFEKPMMGDSFGEVWQLDEDERNKDGDPYDSQFETSSTDFSFVDPALKGVTKNGAFLEITSDLVNQTNIEVTPVWDGAQGDTILFDLGGLSAALDSFELDVDMLAADGISTVRRKLTGSGRRLKLIVANDELDDEIRISEVLVEFTTGDERT